MARWVALAATRNVWFFIERPTRKRSGWMLARLAIEILFTVAFR
jgi:hypothetical protein